MKIPKEILGNHKIRDFKICSLWFTEYYTQKEIAQKFGITQQAVSAIVYKNRALLKLDKEYEKNKRIVILKRQIEKKPDSNKDVADLLDQLRVETEGNKVEHSGSINTGERQIIIVRADAKDERILSRI